MITDDALQLLTGRQVAGLIRVSKSTLYAMVADRRLPAPLVLSARGQRWRRTDLVAWMQEREVDGKRRVAALHRKPDPNTFRVMSIDRQGTCRMT